MKIIPHAEAASRWVNREPVLVRCTSFYDAWVELSEDYGLSVLQSTEHEFAIPEYMKLNGKEIPLPNKIGVESDNGVLLLFNTLGDRLAFLQSIDREGLVK